MPFKLSRKSKPSTATVCQGCAKLGFDANDPPFGSEDVEVSRTWGTYRSEGLDEMRNNTECAFCRLVYLATCEAERGEMKINGKITYHGRRWVEMTWDQRTGPGGAFVFVGATGFGTMICFVKESDQSKDLARNSTVRSFLPITEPQLCVNRASHWLSVCEKNHGNACNPSWSQASTSGPVIPGLRVLPLIDVVNKCLVEIKTSRRYLILSYVWGGVNNVRLTTANRNSLLQKGVLKTIWDILPRTIQDAISIVEQLNERFLWVDALCLVQNDEDDMRSGIEVMDLIYERATLTIIAASGDNANAGLPGSRDGSRRVTNHIEEIQPGIRLAVYNELDHLLRPSAYSRRAWTFQEQYLSRRALYFTNDQVYFRCRESTWSENCVDQFSAPNNTNFYATLLPEAWKMTAEQECRTVLLYYTPRTLTNQNDALNAMAGIIRRISSRMRCRFFQGLPTATFDMFISFNPENSMLRRRQGFPSYSWAGWIGRVAFYEPLLANDWLHKNTWIIWYKRNSTASVNLVWDVMANESFPTSDMSFLGYRKRYLFGDRHSLPFSTSGTIPTEEYYFDREFPPYPILQFWTLAVYFIISDLEVFEAKAYIKDRHGDNCGHMNMDGFEESTFFEAKGPLEFIVLSEREEDDWTRKTREWSYPSTDDIYKYYNVLLLEWNGGIAERRGLGVTSQEAVENSIVPGPIWKEIFLA